MTRDIMERHPLLDDRGRLIRDAWAREDVFAYNKSALSSQGRRQEWEIYQLVSERFFLRLTYGHGGWLALAETLFVDLETGERHVFADAKRFPGDSYDLDFSPAQPHSIKHEEDGFFLSVHANGEHRRLDCRGDGLDVRLVCSDAGDAICNAMSYRNRHQFLYSYKKNHLNLRGHVYLHGREYSLGDAFLVRSSTRGVLPWRHQWVWGSGSCRKGRHILGINIGWGLGEGESATENALFWDGEIHKLDRIWVDRNQDPMQPWRFQSNDGRFQVRFEPAMDSKRRRRFLLFSHSSQQLYGTLYGTVKLDDGRVLRVDGMPFVCEHVENRG